MFRKALIPCALIFLFIAWPTNARAKTGGILILVDLSNSAAHVQSAPVAAKMGAYVARLVAQAPLGARVSLRTFGTASSVQNWLALDYRLSRRQGAKPKEIGRKLGLVLASLPKLIKQKQLALQKETHVMRALQDLSGSALNPGGTLVLLSDLMEYSSDADCYHLVRSGSAGLPAPPTGLLSGVRVIALGAGFGLKASGQSARLKAMWGRWFRQAGALEFRFIPRL